LNKFPNQEPSTEYNPRMAVASMTATIYHLVLRGDSATAACGTEVPMDIATPEGRNLCMLCKQSVTAKEPRVVLIADHFGSFDTDQQRSAYQPRHPGDEPSEWSQGQPHGSQLVEVKGIIYSLTADQAAHQAKS